MHIFKLINTNIMEDLVNDFLKLSPSSRLKSMAIIMQKDANLLLKDTK